MNNNNILIYRTGGYEEYLTGFWSSCPVKCNLLRQIIKFPLLVCDSAKLHNKTPDLDSQTEDDCSRQTILYLYKISPHT